MICLLVKLEDGHGNFGSGCGLQCCILCRTGLVCVGNLSYVVEESQSLANHIVQWGATANCNVMAVYFVKWGMLHSLVYSITLHSLYFKISYLPMVAR